MSTEPDLAGYLRSLGSEELVALLLERAEADPELLRSLRLRASRARGDRPETATFGAVLDTVQRLLDAGTSTDVTALARRAVESGAAGAELDRAVALYARACAVHPPDQEALADWITGVAFDGPAGPRIALVDFAGALGDRGLRLLRSTADRELRSPDPARRCVAERLREQLAEIAGEVDELVAILSRRLPRHEVSLKVMRVLRAAGRHAEAIGYAADAMATDAAQRVAEQPSEIIEVYRASVRQLIEHRDAAHYRQAAEQLCDLRAVHERAGSLEEFGSYLAELTATHKRKTRLLTELRNARLHT